MERAQSQPGCAPKSATPTAQPSAALPRAPWIVTDDIYLEDADGLLLADFAPHGAFGPGHVATAHLAAAAPDLLEALTELVEFADKMTGRVEPEYRQLAYARAAISKATGEA